MKQRLSFPFSCQAAVGLAVLLTLMLPLPASGDEKTALEDYQKGGQAKLKANDAEAEHFFRKALADNTLPPKERIYATSALGYLLSKSKRDSEALALHLQLLEFIKTLPVAPFPLDEQLIAIYSNLSHNAVATQNLAVAEEANQQLLALQERLHGPTSPEAENVRLYLAEIRQAASRSAFKTPWKALMKLHADASTAYYDDDLVRSESLIQQYFISSQQMIDTKIIERDPNITAAHILIALLRIEQARFEEAEAALNRAEQNNTDTTIPFYYQRKANILSNRVLIAFSRNQQDQAR